MHSLLLVLVLGLVAQAATLPVDLPPATTGRVLMREDLQIVTRRVDGRFEIVARERTGGTWGAVSVVHAAPAGHVALAASLSPDGRRLFFESNARTPAVTGRDDTDAWVIERTAAGWGTPRPLGDPWATPANEHAMTMAGDGVVCLNSARPGGLGENDIYCSRSLDEAPVLARDLSSPAQDAFAVLSERGDAIVFASDRPGGLGGWDLYAARRTVDGWSRPVNLGSPVNTADDELNPWLDRDRLVFVRTGSGRREVLSLAPWRMPALP